MEDTGDHLDNLGEQAGLYKLYTQLCLCFGMTNAASRSDIVNTLTQGLGRLAASFPWVAGQVINHNVNGYKIAGYEKTPRMVVKNNGSMPTMEDFRQARFPANMLDESAAAPINTLAAGTEGPAPVFVLQANFIDGGLLLTFVTQHNTMDMTGMAQIMYLLSKACRNEPFTAEELRIGNLDRRNLIPLLDDSYTPGPELANQIKKPAAGKTISAAHGGELDVGAPPQCSWVYFLFSGASLTSLKSLAMKSITRHSSFVSTDDVLSAFVWQAVTKARLSRLKSWEETTFARAVDPRRYLDISATYPGLVQNMTYTSSNIEGLVAEPVGSIASKLREAVDPKTSNIGYATRALTTWRHLKGEESNINVMATVNLSKDIALSSWAKYNCYDLDFNLGLGKPEAVRRPAFTPVESLFYLMPKTPDGEIAALLCLREEDLEKLKTDVEFMRYAAYIG